MLKNIIEKYIIKEENVDELFIQNIPEIINSFEEYLKIMKKDPNNLKNYVTQEFLNENKISINDLNLISCKRCFNCMNCLNCNDCMNCCGLNNKSNEKNLKMC